MVENASIIREYGFEKLIVWQSARKLVKEIYNLTKTLPSEEKYGLISQIQRAIIPVSSNLAEGGHHVRVIRTRDILSNIQCQFDGGSLSTNSLPRCRIYYGKSIHYH